MGVKSFNVGVLLCTAMLTLPAATFAQSAASAVNQSPVTGQVESPQERMSRLGTESDPGPDPDPQKHWFRFGKEYVIEKYDKSKAAYDQPKGFVRPQGNINVQREIYQEDEKSVWVWSLVPGQPNTHPEANAPILPKKFTDEDLKWVRQIIPDLKPLEVAQSAVTLKFRDASEGLPTNGSWRNSLGVGDFNEDGQLDLIVPPFRGSANGVPQIFLGDGKGHWTLWEKASFPTGINYGSTEVADFNGDGHLDVVCGVHLYGIQVFLGNGKGYFVDGSKGLPVSFPTRRAIVVDLNKDGKPDIAAISEGPGVSDRNDPNPVEKPKLRAFLNDGKSNWTETSVSEVGRMLGGDWLVSGDFDGNKQPDLAGSSNYFNSPDNIYLNDGKKWKNVSRGWMPFYTYYGALTANHFTSKSKDDLIVSFARLYPTSLPSSVQQQPELKEIAGVERISWTKDGPVRTSIMRWPSHKGIWSMASADFDGDGNVDFVFGKIEPREYVFLLGDGAGGFKRARFEGIEVPENTTYDIKIADVNRDGRPDVILMYETRDGHDDGSIHVYLNETGKPKKVK